MKFKPYSHDLNKSFAVYQPSIGRTPEQLLGPLFKDYFYAWIEDEIDVYPILISKMMYEYSSFGVVKALTNVFDMHCYFEKISLKQFKVKHKNSKVKMLLDVDLELMVKYGVAIVLLSDPPKNIIIPGYY